VVLAIIRKMMNWYATRNDDYSSPIVRGMHRHNGGDHKRKRTLSDDEIRAVWTARADAGTFGALVKTLLLTGQRRDKVATMRWDDIVDGEWRIASAAREKSNAGSLRLPPAVLDVINAQPHIAGNPYVFAGRGSGPFNSFSQRHSYDAEKADALARLATLVDRIVNPPEGNVVSLTETAETAPKRGRLPDDHRRLRRPQWHGPKPVRRCRAAHRHAPSMTVPSVASRATSNPARRLVFRPTLPCGPGNRGGGNPGSGVKKP
jgi:hypothetical protein